MTHHQLRPAPLVTTTWEIDAGHSWVDVNLIHREAGNIKGRFRNVRGWAALDEGDFSRSRFAVEIESRSLEFEPAFKNYEAAGAAFLDAHRFPRILFQSRSINPLGPERMRVRGDLTLRGESRPIGLDLRSRGRATDMHGKVRESFSASTTVYHQTFGMMWNRGLARGSSMVAEEVAIDIEVELVRSDPGPKVA